MARKLTAVPPDARPAKLKPLSLTQAIDATDRDVLVSSRLHIAREIDNGVPPAYLAPLTRQLLEIDRQIRALDARAEQEAADGGEVADEAFSPEAL